MSWFRNGIPQFIAPTEIVPTSFPSPSSCKHKRQRSQPEIRAIYWKQQWNEKTVITFRVQRKGILLCTVLTKTGTMENNSRQNLQPPHFSRFQKVTSFFPEKRNTPAPIPNNDVRRYWIIPGSWLLLHSSKPPWLLQKFNPFLGQNKDNKSSKRISQN